MKKLLASMMCVMLVPAMAFAGSTARAPQDSAQQTAPAAAPAPAPAPGAADSKDEKKDGEKKDEKSGGALANAVAARTPEAQAAQSGFQVQVSLDHYLGAGTFVNPNYYAYLAANLTIGVQYLTKLLSKSLVISGTARGSLEYTLSDQPNGRRFEPGDTRFGMSMPALFRESVTGIAFTPSLGVSVPTSYASLNNGLIAGISLGITASRSFGKFDFRAQGGGSRAFHTQTVVGTKASSNSVDAFNNKVVLSRPGEFFGAIVGNNTAWSANIGGSVQFRATDNLLFYVSYTYQYLWRYDVNNSVVADQYTTRKVDVNGRPVADNNEGQFDRTSSAVGLSYQLNEHYSFDFGVSTTQTPLFADGKTVRFPFLSIGTWADNATIAYFTLSAAY